jgi:hypothetical protein
MKDTFYFSHDYNARSDDKIKPILRKFGMLGYGIFWSIIEDLYNNANALRTDYESIAFDLHSEANIIKSIINDFDLFVVKDCFFGSLSVQKRLEERNSKSLKAKESAFKRWNKDANALPTHSERIEIGCDSNAIKERKGKEIKINFEHFPEYEKILLAWFEYKRCKKQSYKNIQSQELFYKSLLKLSNSNIEMATKIINQSMANNWSGIFELKQEHKKGFQLNTAII